MQVEEAIVSFLQMNGFDWEVLAEREADQLARELIWVAATCGNFELART